MINEVDPTASELAQVARLLHRRNEIDRQIAAIIQRPVAAGHFGKWFASAVFDIELKPSFTTATIDGRFSAGKLPGHNWPSAYAVVRPPVTRSTETSRGYEFLEGGGIGRCDVAEALWWLEWGVLPEMSQR
jgi:hypothetical protein